MSAEYLLTADPDPAETPIFAALLAATLAPAEDSEPEQVAS